MDPSRSKNRSSILSLIFISVTALISFATFVGCGTVLTRQGEGPTGEVFPGTKVDLGAIIEVGIKGEPLFAAAPTNPESDKKSSPLIRVLFTLGGLIDLPVSLSLDTLFLPFDLFHLDKE